MSLLSWKSNCEFCGSSIDCCLSKEESKKCSMNPNSDLEPESGSIKHFGGEEDNDEWDGQNMPHFRD